MAQLTDALDVNAAEVGVGGGLREVQCHRVALQCLLQCLKVIRRDDGHANVHFGQELLHELARAPVAVAGGDDVATRGHQRQQHARHAVHARRGYDAVLGTLQRHQLFLHRFNGRVPVAPVLVAVPPALIEVNDLLRVVEEVGGGLCDGRGKRVVVLLPPGPLSLMDALAAHPLQLLLLKELVGLLLLLRGGHLCYRGAALGLLLLGSLDFGEPVGQAGRCATRPALMLHWPVLAWQRQARAEGRPSLGSHRMRRIFEPVLTTAQHRVNS
mmetsp:Transcript_12752/g.34767  ORF Transcript_12752/g.34767 Transcript_12752/m.34767 type:complete len:270 (-) Transcript_12752:125-934(-)